VFWKTGETAAAPSLSAAVSRLQGKEAAGGRAAGGRAAGGRAAAARSKQEARRSAAAPAGTGTSSVERERRASSFPGVSFRFDGILKGRPEFCVCWWK